VGEGKGLTCPLSFSRLVFWILELFVPSPSSNKHKCKIRITSSTSHSICTSKTLKASTNTRIIHRLLTAYELYCFFLCVFPRALSCHLLMKNKQEFIIYYKVYIFQQWFKMKNTTLFLLSFCYQRKKNSIITSAKLILSLACCPMERPTCSFLAQDFVSCVIQLLNLKMKNILQQIFFWI
jgi:hypothetical protein